MKPPVTVLAVKVNRLLTTEEAEFMEEKPIIKKTDGKFRKLKSLADLYPELLTHIFGYLNTREKGMVSQCCHYFNEICKNRQIWKGTLARLNLKPNQTSIYQNMSARGITNVQVLSLKRSLRDLTSHVPVKKLKLSGCYNVTDYTLNSAVNLHNLVDLDLSLCKQITDMSLYSIIGKAPNLKVLDVGGCGNLTDKSLLLIAYALRELETFNGRSIYNLTDRAIGFLAGEVKINEPKLLHFLIKLGLIENPSCVICKQGASSSSSRSKNKYLLPKITNLTTFGMIKLKTLVLQDCQKLSDQTLEYISQIPTLESLNLSFCVNITDVGIRHLKRLPLLSELNLRSCDNISDATFVYLKDCLKIEHLDVSFCEKISILNHLSKNLKTLGLSATKISDSALVDCTDFPRLHTLNIAQTDVTDVGLRAIAEKCCQLAYMDLYGCAGVTTKGMEVIMGIPTLKHVNLGLWKV